MNWAAAAFIHLEEDAEHYTYVVRLIAFGLIIAAIVHKNRADSR